MPINADFLTRTLAELVRIDSVNPAFGGTQAEAAAAEYAAGVLWGLGMEVERREPEPGRVSVVGRLPGTGGGRSLMLYAHLDTVGVEGMEAPFEPVVRDGRMYGRGAYDMKAGMAACLAAAEALVRERAPLRGDLRVVGVADEEEASMGMADVLTAHKTDAAIVTEPTELQLCLAHKGFCWIEVVVEGQAAHGSRPGEGIDANLHMGRFLARLEGVESRLRASAPHPLVGRPSLHAGVLAGGSAPSVYAARSRVVIERRTLPGETEAEAVAEIQAVVDALAAEDPGYRATVRPLLTRGAWEARPGAAVVGAVEEAATAVLGAAPARIGHSFWMDAALLEEAGVETAVIGHAGGGAHAVVEWVDLASAARLAEILARAAASFCG